MHDRKGVSLSDELHHIMRAVDGVRELAEGLYDSAFDDGTVPLSIASSLVLIKERIRLVDRVVRGDVDPQFLLCPQNVAEASTDGSGDVVIRPWSDKKTLRRLRKDWKAAKRRMRRARVGR